MKIRKIVNENIYAYYHSLRMLPVYLTKQEHENLQHGIFHENLISSLKEAHILVDDEADLIECVRNCVPEPYICVTYFILTEQCNFACKYCFLGNSSERPKVTDYPMSKDTAMKALLFFAEQTRKKPEYFNEEKNIIFYGGEPLLNFDTLKFIVEKSRELQKQNLISKNLKFSIVTNGTLLDSEKIKFLIENEIETSISLDGATEKSNSARIFKNGGYVYYEERFARKLKSFVNQKIYFSDCAATSGNQIVITPDGKVGICHGCIEKREYFIADINDNCNLNENENILAWRKLSPVFKNECLSCEALGICGGGCPVNAENINAVDSDFCIHAKMSLEFLIAQLYSAMIE